MLLFFIATFLVQESTVHGVRYFIDGENAVHKFAWVVIMVCSVRFFINGENITDIMGKDILRRNTTMSSRTVRCFIKEWNI